MKNFMSPLATFLVAVSFNGAAATDSSQLEEKLSSFRNILTELSTSLENPKANLGVDDWTSQLACTVDSASDQPSLIDEAACASAKDSDNQDCIWCDATATIIGQGVCLSHDAQSMLGQLCAADGTDTTPVDPPTNPPAAATVTPKPTPSPTPPPTDATPAPDDDQIPCSVDASSNLISDEGTCVAKKDSTSTSGANCKWCSNMLGATCITDQSKLSFLCSKEEEEGLAKKGGNYLRGDKDKDDNNGGGWRKLDSSCLGEASDGLDGGDEESCGDRKDSSGNPCIWCDAGDDVFGICATPEQKDYLGSYLTCADPESPVVVTAVE
mmetsp:Transcript_459/g.1020  ORF Transcript_459/g.1020 Transcript_459/m.1020 type:complete len:325 (+) Transcript_459:83-1057(+)|eukprot:CAMPEP_0201882464 /NCGR_PEP_ID=MMETSP0902-20130614/13925_1 /ASSEMBLY_ACC=CAM_ASM_000551 /TAXON_ID=420261 /ORGANISM="Thalassiosira antarctica, Strain CCMP982" /LENGTH=324 /DNA_ID=CAMNT_0048410989 /DNA_START=81 /DNA_END=1055 /DNA_ORIENTATION=+